jgi:radical SAM protein with 4Fe4S-binding SPASM domain
MSSTRYDNTAVSERRLMLAKTTPRRLANMAKVTSSYYAARATGKPVQWGLPFSLAFEPTTSCNLRCPECPSGLRSFTRPTGMLDADFFNRTMDEVAPDLSYLIFYFQGEPYLNPKFLDMVEYAGSKGVYTATSTNAHYLGIDNARQTIDSGLDRLIISIDGTDQETYEQYRVGGKLEKVLEGTRNVVDWKRRMNSQTPYIIFQFLVVRPNEHQIEEVQRLGREYGVDEVRLKTAQIYDYEQGSDLIPTKNEFSRYRQEADGKWSIKNPLLNHCWKLWHSCVITWDGLVVPCCFDKDASHQLGDLREQSFREIWQGQPYQNFRKSLLKARSEIDICTNCTEGTQVWAE